MYFSSYSRRLDELERRQRDRPRKSIYRDQGGNKHQATIIKMLSHEIEEQLNGTPSPIRSYTLDDRAQVYNPILAALFELTFSGNRKRRQEK